MVVDSTTDWINAPFAVVVVVVMFRPEEKASSQTSRNRFTERANTEDENLPTDP